MRTLLLPALAALALAACGGPGAPPDAAPAPRLAGPAVVSPSAQVPSTTVVATSGSPSTYGSAVTFTATVTGGAGTPGGDVIFTDGALTLCGGPIALSGGQAACTTGDTLPGFHLITATYQGDANYLASSAFVPQLVDPATPIVVASAAPSPATFGGAVTLSAAVTGLGIVPTGTVQFLDGPLTLCAAALDAAGVAACDAAGLAVGGHLLTAQFGGDAAYAPASADLALLVDRAAAAVALASSLNPSPYGGAVTFTATVTGPGGTPDGAVTFLDGAAVLCGGPRPVSGGVATCTLTGAGGLPGGSHTLTADFDGGTSWLPATSPALVQQVNRIAPAVSLASSAPVSVYGTPVTFTATVGGAAAPPAGEVTFSEGATVLCGPVALAGGKADCTIATLGRGSHLVTAAYAGDASYLGGSASRSQVVTPATPAIAVLAAPSPSVFGQPVAVTVTVSAAGLGGAPTGTVTLSTGAAQLCGGPLPLVDGAAGCLVTGLGAGEHLLVAAYSGDLDYDAGAPAARAHTVARALTEAALGVSPAAAVFGEAITLTAAVSVLAPGAGSPAGEVEFRDGATPLGAAALDPLTGLATLEVPSGAGLAVGEHAFSAAYAGDAGFQGSLSPALPPFAIGPASTLTSAASSAAAAAFGEPITFTFTVTPVAPGAGAPGGLLGLRVDGGPRLDLPVSAGVATWVTSALAAGSHALQAEYLGDGAFLGSSTSLGQVVVRAGTAVAASAEPAPSVFGQPVAFDVVVSAVAPGAGAPGGTVRLLEGSTVLATGALDAGGRARLAHARLPVGRHDLAVDYAGDAGFLPGTGAVSHLVQQAFVDVQLTASDPAPIYGAPVTFDVAVTPAFLGVGAPSGAVVLQGEAGPVATLPLDVFGRASLTTAAIPPGAHAFTATYPGDASFTDGASLPAAVTVRAAPVSVGLAVGPNPSAAGERVTWSVQVVPAAPSAAAADGVVQLLDGGQLLEELTLDASGRASGGSAALAVGAHLLTARYLATPRFEAATSPAVSQQVALAQVSVAVSADPSPSTFGAPVTLTAQVEAQPPGAGAPGGLVTFADGGQPLGAAPLDAAGRASLPVAGLGVGAHALTATFPGDAVFAPRTSAPLAHAVLKAGSAAQATVAPSTAVTGQPVTFSVSVTSAAGTPGGRVELAEAGGGTLGSALLDASGRAAFTTTALAVGSHQVVASYPGDADHQPATAPPVGAVILAAATATSLEASPAAPVAGQPLSLTAAVLPVAPGAGAPSGAVTFRDGPAVLGAAPVDPVTRRATLPLPGLPAGPHALTAAYAGDGAFTASASDALALEVGQASAVVTIAAAPAAPVHGQPVTLSVAVAAAPPAAGVPAGEVVVRDGAAVLGTATLSGGAAAVQAVLDAGDHQLTASYAGDASFLPASAARALPVAPAATATGLATSGSPSTYGQPVTLTATVRTLAPGGGAPDGAVIFRDGTAALGAAAVGPGGVAALTTTALPPGARAVAAEYGGSARYGASRATLTQDVVQAQVTLAVTASPSPAEHGQPVVVSIAASAPGGVIPAGQVTLLDGAATAGGPAALDAAGRAAFPLAGLGGGVHALTAVLAPATGFTTAAGSASLTVTAAATTLALDASRNPSRAGWPVTLTATAGAAHATPAGAVTFEDGGRPLGSAPLVDGVARLTTRALAKGRHPLTARLAGSADFEAATAALDGGLLVENSPPVAGSGGALLLGPGRALRAAAEAAGALDGPAGTVELWARAAWTDPSQAGPAPTLARLGDASGARWSLGVTPARTGLTVSLGSGTTVVPARLDDGAWHQVALSAGPAGVAVLLDGVQVGAIDGGFGAAPGDRLTVGEGFTGELDELRVWSVARTAAAVAAGARRPVTGGEPGLRACWRMDEEAGAELFDAGPAGLTLTAAADGGLAPVRGASAAWARRQAWRDRPLEPIDAGYDADGDPLALALTGAPAHGDASVDQPLLQVGYRPAAGYTGPDQLSYRLTDGDGAWSAFDVALQVDRILACGVDADCSGGDVCSGGACVAPGGAAGGGCGCASGGGGLALWSLLGLAALAARRRPRRGGAA